MPSLHETQALLSGALLHGHGADAVAELLRAGHGAAPQRRVQVYRNNLFESLEAALRAVFPVTARLLGDGFFRRIARGYIVENPSRSGDLHAFGARLPDHLEAKPSLAGLPYLGDVARLEWACHEVFHEADEATFDAAPLARVPSAAQPRIRLELQRASRLVSSPYPVLAIWRANQAASADAVAPVSLDEGGVRLLVARRDSEVEFRILAEGESAFLHALAEHRPLAAALAAALAIEPGFDLGGTLARHVALGSFRGWSLAEPEDEAP